jgi:hypothetical protein
MTQRNEGQRNLQEIANAGNVLREMKNWRDKFDQSMGLIKMVRRGNLWVLFLT